jgi:hypothetical protein
MAERSAVANKLHPQYISVSWTGLLNTDTGSGFDAEDMADRTVQVFGTFSTGGAMTFQGSNDGTNWFTLTDTVGAAIVLTAAGGKVVAEAPRFVRPNITAGDGSTNLSVLMVARR